MVDKEEKERMKKVSYNSFSKSSFWQRIREMIPESAHPTDRTPKILGIIFTLVVIIGALKFPFFGIFGGNVDVEVGIGMPYVFLNLKLANNSADIINTKYLIIDILIYILLSYMIDIIINVITHADFIKSKEELASRPKEYQVKR